MAEKDTAKGVEAAEVTPLPPTDAPVEGTRMDPHPDKPAKMPPMPKGKTGTWEPVSVADDPNAHYDHEQVWVEHHGLDNGHWAKGQLFRFVEDAT